MTEIPLKVHWLVEKAILKNVQIGQEFTTSDIAQVLRAGGLIGPNTKIHHEIDAMHCVEKTQAGGVGGWKEKRNPNKYKRITGPGQICTGCPVQSCLIQNPEVATQLGLDNLL